MPDSDTLIYLEIAESIRRLIVSGELKPGEQLPSIRQQARVWRCTPGTVSRAYAKLAEEGLVSGRRGAGTVVTERALQAAPTAWRWATLVNQAESFLLGALRDGHTPAQIQTALSAAVTRWQELQGVRTPQTGASPADTRLRFVGSHDLALESLPQLLARHKPGSMLSLEYAGSLGGLMALARGEADVSGIHLWDAATDTYNGPFVQRVLPGRSTILLTLFRRSLGLIVPPGNPQQLSGLHDLRRPEVIFVNRQPGSGTRVWLDAQLKSLGIATQSIVGYMHEQVTHVGIARAVAEKRATAGLGIEAAAESYGLGFVPCTKETYDLVFPEEVWHTDSAQSLVEVIRSPEFRQTVLQLKGYDVSDLGHESRIQ